MDSLIHPLNTPMLAVTLTLLAVSAVSDFVLFAMRKRTEEMAMQIEEEKQRRKDLAEQAEEPPQGQ